jgi:mannosyltransferase
MKGKPAGSPVYILLGIIGLLAAALVSGAQLERAFGRPPGSLAWGPALFRVLLALHGCALLMAGLRRRTYQSASGKSISRPTVLLLTALTLVAIVLRIPNLNSSLWLDEVLTMARYAKPPFSQIFTNFPDQNQHMLYSLMAHGALRLFGEQAWSLRLPSVIFGAASIWALFLLGRKISGEAEALLACGLMTVSYHHIWFSQNARGYMGLLFFTLLATWLWLEVIDRDEPRLWAGYTLCVVLGLWIHMTMLFVLATHILIFFVVWLRSGKNLGRFVRAATAFALCSTVTLQLFALSLPEFLRTGLAEVSPPSEWTNPLWAVLETMRGLQVGFAGTAVVVCGGVLAALGWLDILRRTPAAAWAMVLPGAMGGGLMLASAHNLWPRFFFFSMGFGLLIAIRGAVRVPELLLRWFSRSDARRPAIGYALAGLFIVASAFTVPRAYALPKQDFIGARDYVERHRTPDERVIVVGLAAHAYTEYYAPEWPMADSADQIQGLLRNGQPLLLVYTLPIELKADHPDIWKMVEADFETVKIFPGTLGGGEVYVCRER